MIPKLSRYLLVVLALTTFAYVLPAIYNTLFDVRINLPYTTYSTTKKEYYSSHWIDGKSVFTDRHGNTYSQQEFMDNTPVENFYYHLSKGTMPDSIAGMKIYPQQLQKETFMAWMELENMNVPEYGINPLFESQSEFGLAFSKDYFRIRNRIEFIDAKSNKLNEAKSKLFTEALSRGRFLLSCQAHCRYAYPDEEKRRWLVHHRQQRAVLSSQDDQRSALCSKRSTCPRECGSGTSPATIMTPMNSLPSSSLPTTGSSY